MSHGHYRKTLGVLLLSSVALSAQAFAQATATEVDNSEQAIQRAIKQARAMFAYGSENITNQGFWLGYAEMFDHYQWFECYMDQLEKVTAADVQRIAQTYLNPARRVVGVYLPNGEEVEEEIE